jgi:hypothetical protein
MGADAFAVVYVGFFFGRQWALICWLERHEFIPLMLRTPVARWSSIG